MNPYTRKTPTDICLKRIEKKIKEMKKKLRMSSCLVHFLKEEKEVFLVFLLYKSDCISAMCNP
jgi:hypothetical protein